MAADAIDNSSRRDSKRIAAALWANAVVLGGILLVLIVHGGGNRLPTVTPKAMAEQGAINGGAGVFLMPGQLAQNLWGVYLMDVDRQTLLAYEYLPGTHQLHLVTGRGFRFDRDVTNLGTTPSPDEVRQWVQQAKNGNRQAGPDVQPPDATKPEDTKSK